MEDIKDLEYGLSRIFNNSNFTAEVTYKEREEKLITADINILIRDKDTGDLVDTTGLVTRFVGGVSKAEYEEFLQEAYDIFVSNAKKGYFSRYLKA